ncbi:MAG: glycosyltransferase [Candidatus Omnitrophica bacterium]|nr:glycosyltransferase [Candidatus Omnitrophota bacterium]HOX54459.1 glycosyltransferase [Candidatus Omnitrophota bacterium]
MRKINVLHIVEDLSIGGVEELLRIIAMGLNREKYNVYVCCIEEGGQTAKELMEAGIKVDILGMKSYHNLFNILRLKKYIKERKIDIIHSHMYFANTFGRIAALLAGTPVLISTSYSTYYEFKRRNILMINFLSKFTDRIIAASNSIKEFAVKQQRIPADKFQVIYDCASTDKFSKHVDSFAVKRALGIDSDYQVVGCVARLNEVKGHAYLIRAAKEVLKNNPRIKFLLVGDGPLRQELEQLSVQLGIKDNVIFVGSRRDIPEMLAAMDIFVLPSALREGCPLSILEAMAMSKPVVASRLGGIPEEIEDGKSGILVPPKDSAALADAIIKLLSDKNLSVTMGKAGRKIFEEKFSKEVMLNKLESLYDELAAKKLTKRILYVDIHGDIWGGGQLSFLSILELIDKTSLKPIVVLPYEGDLSKRIREMGIEVCVIPFGSIKTTNIFVNLFSIFRFYALIKKRKINLIHINALRPMFYTGLAAKIAGVPVIWHARDLKANRWIDRILSNLARHIIAISKIVAGRFPWYENNPDRLSIIYNGIDTGKLSPRPRDSRVLHEFHIEEDEAVVGTIGHLEPRKGQDIFLQAASNVLLKFPNSKFVLVGKDMKNGEKYKSDLEYLITWLKIEDKVVFAGVRKDIAEVISIMDLFICPFKDEAFGRVVIEAMAMAKPVIGYRSGALPELIEDGKSGILVDPDRADCLADAIIELLGDRDKAMKFGEAGRKIVQDKFDVKTTVNRIEEVYFRILH